MNVKEITSRKLWLYKIRKRLKSEDWGIPALDAWYKEVESVKELENGVFGELRE